MKIRMFAPWVVALILAVAAGAQPATTTDPKKPAPKSDPKSAPAVPAKKVDAKKKADEIGKIEGMEIPRGTGFLGLKIADGVFKLTAYDAKKKPTTTVDFTKVALRWSAPYQPNPERALLTPGGGPGSFTSEKVIKPPHTFRLFVTLIKGEASDAPVENLVVEFHP
jgi:hypothetical protein